MGVIPPPALRITGGTASLAAGRVRPGLLSPHRMLNGLVHLRTLVSCPRRFSGLAALTASTPSQEGR